MKLKCIEQTCDACPSQWEARDIDDRPVYIRYRWGTLEIGVGNPNADMSDAVDKSMSSKPDYLEFIGGAMSGTIELEAVMPFIESIPEYKP